MAIEKPLTVPYSWAKLRKEGSMRPARIVLFVFAFVCVTSLVFAADITGKWASKSAQGPQWVFNFKCEGSNVTGMMLGSDEKERPIKEGKLEGDDLSFSVDSEWQGQPITLVMKGKVSEEEIQLRVDTEDGAWGTDLDLVRSPAK
jgi:hypothetical protein